MRKAGLAQFLSDQVDGIFIAKYEKAKSATCCSASPATWARYPILEGIVSKHLDRAYGAGRHEYWLRVKNRQHPAYSRVKVFGDGAPTIVTFPQTLRTEGTRA
jgi:bifunctional non-homologous end joining protein LigD